MQDKHHTGDYSSDLQMVRSSSWQIVRGRSTRWTIVGCDVGYDRGSGSVEWLGMLDDCR